MVDRLSIEEVETIARSAESQERTPAYSALAVNIKLLAHQLAETMRENEHLKHSLDAFMKRMPIVDGENKRLKSVLEECKDNIAKWGKGESDFYRFLCDNSNEDSDNGQ